MVDYTRTLVGLSWFFFSSRRRHTRWTGDWSSDVCSSDLVVDVALQPPALLVLGRDQALAGRLQLVEPGQQLLREPHVSKDQPRPRRQVAGQVLFGRREPITGGLDERERPQGLAAVLDGQGERGLGRRETVAG